MINGVAAWIALDWGTSNLRAYAIDDAGNVVNTRKSPKGMGVLAPGQFETALIELIEPWLQSNKTIPVLACGMIGAKQGWCEAPYQKVPYPITTPVDLTIVETSDRRIKVGIIPGLSQTDPADVMRGEETQIAGLLAKKPGFEGIVCLPGTHSKWVEINSGKVDRFQTFMTGEVYSLISQQSVLRFSLGDKIGEFDEDCFLETIVSSMNDPFTIAGNFFKIRADSLLHSLKPRQAKSKLSGLLIANELVSSRSYWTGNTVDIVATPEVSRLYQKAFEVIGVTICSMNVEEATLAGMKLVAATTGISGFSERCN